jgi:hypothetical protein
MSDLTNEEKYIVEKLQEEGGRMDYKRLQQFCEDEFEGVRLVLKKLKEKGLVDYEGVIPGFSAEISLLKEE